MVYISPIISSRLQVLLKGDFQTSALVDQISFEQRRIRWKIQMKSLLLQAKSVELLKNQDRLNSCRNEMGNRWYLPFGHCYRHTQLKYNLQQIWLDFDALNLLLQQKELCTCAQHHSLVLIGLLAILKGKQRCVCLSFHMSCSSERESARDREREEKLGHSALLSGFEPN